MTDPVSVPGEEKSNEDSSAQSTREVRSESGAPRDENADRCVPSLKDSGSKVAAEYPNKAGVAASEPDARFHPSSPDALGVRTIDPKKLHDFGELLVEEMQERKWTTADVAARMAGYFNLELDMLIALAESSDPHVLPDVSMLDRMETVFGVSDGFFRRLLGIASSPQTTERTPDADDLALSDRSSSRQPWEPNKESK